MLDQNLLTIFLAITALAAFIQAGLIAGLAYLSFSMSRKADQAMAEVRRAYEPVHRMAGAIEKTAAQLKEFSAVAQVELQRLSSTLDRTLEQFGRRGFRWGFRGQ